MSAVACSFCDESEAEARCIVQGPPGHNICDACILLCVDILLGHNRSTRGRRFVATPVNDAAVDRRAERFLVDRVAELRASIPVHAVDAEITAWCHRFIDEWDRAVRAEARRGGREVGCAFDDLMAQFDGEPGRPYRIALLSFADGRRPDRPMFYDQARSLARLYGVLDGDVRGRGR